MTETVTTRTTARLWLVGALHLNPPEMLPRTSLLGAVPTGPACMGMGMAVRRDDTGTINVTGRPHTQATRG